MTKPAAPKPAFPPHPTRRNARRMVLMGVGYGLFGVGLAIGSPGSRTSGAIVLLSGVLIASVGLWMWRQGPAVMLNNAAQNLLQQGRYDEAAALLDTIPVARRVGIVGMAVLSQRAAMLFGSGDTAGALAALDEALAVKGQLFGRPQERQYRLTLRANRALVLAAAGDADAARAEATFIVAAPESSPQHKGLAALARAVTHARSGAREALASELNGSRAVLDVLNGREAALRRTLDRFVAVPAGGAYRAPASYDGTPSATARWIASVVPQAAAFAPRASEHADPVDPARLPAVTAEAQARVAADRASATKQAPNLARQGTVVWVAIVAAYSAATLGGLVSGGIDAWMYVAGFVVLLGYLLRRNRRVERDIRAAQSLYAAGRHADSDALLQGIATMKTHSFAAVALGELAEHAERRDDLPEALALIDRAIGHLSKNALARAQSSDIVFPSFVALRARVLAAMDRTDEALAELDVIARDHPTFPLVTSAALSVRMMVALRLGDRALARELARTRGPDARLARHVDVLCDLLVGDGGWYEADGERDRLAAELSADPGLRAWIERLAPGLTTPLTTMTGVRIAEHEEPTDTADAEAIEAEQLALSRR